MFWINMCTTYMQCSVYQGIYSLIPRPFPAFAKMGRELGTSHHLYVAQCLL